MVVGVGAQLTGPHPPDDNEKLNITMYLKFPVLGHVVSWYGQMHHPASLNAGSLAVGNNICPLSRGPGFEGRSLLGEVWFLALLRTLATATAGGLLCGTV